MTNNRKNTLVQWFRSINKHHPQWINSLLVAGSVLFIFILFEAGFRLYIKTTDPELAAVIQRFSWEAKNETTGTRFVPHPYFSYAPRSIQYKDDGIQIRNQFFSFQKPKGIIRVACLGGSTTMEQYPLYLKEALQKEIGSTTPIEVMDFGCDGWTLMESTLNYIVRISDFSPDYVVVHHGMNDVAGRIWPHYKPDYTHYRKTYQEKWLGWFSRKYLSFSWMVTYLLYKSGMSSVDILNLTTHTVPYDQLVKNPDPKTLGPFKKDFRTLYLLIHTQGGQMLYMPMAYCRAKADFFNPDLIEEFNKTGRHIASELSVPIVETQPSLEKKPELFKDIVHLVPEGNKIKARLLAKTIATCLAKN